jgi:hypothetical protein
VSQGHCGYDFGPGPGGGGGESESSCLKVIRGIFSTHTLKGAKVFLFCCSLCLYSNCNSYLMQTVFIIREICCTVYWWYKE